MPADGSTRTQRYRRLLRWYPRAWREANGDAMLGTLMDASDGAAGDRPSTGEAWSLRVYGLGYRLDARAALAFASAAVAALVIAGAVGLLGYAGFTPAVSIAIGPTLLSLAACALLRRAGVLTPPRSVFVAVLATVAWSVALVAALSWSVGFDEADAGATTSGFAQLFAGFFLVAWAFGALAIALVLVAPLPGVGPAWARWLVALATAAIAAPILGLSAMQPTLGLLVGVALLVLAIRAVARERAVAHGVGVVPATIAAASTPRHVPRGIRRRLGVLSWISAALGLAAVAFALAGSLWPGVEADSTRTMQLGLAAGSLAGIPMLVGIALALTSRGAAARSVWPAVGAFVTALVIAAVASLGGSTDAQWPLVLAAAAAAGIGAGLTAYALARMSTPMRVLVALAVGAAFAASIAVGVVMMAAFLLPVAGIAFGIWGMREPRAEASAAVSAPGAPAMP